MSLGQNKISCALCGAYLFEEDDVVYCPVCGAPHHRECYNSIGHCACEQTHGTDEQYDKVRLLDTEPEKAEPINSAAPNFCTFCGEKYDKAQPVCPRCGKSPSERYGNANGANFGAGYTVINIDPLGGVPADADVGDGVTAEEVKRFVVSNSPRYCKRFSVFKTGVKRSFNLFGMLFPVPWLFSRKMYRIGTIFAALQVALKLVLMPLATEVAVAEATAENYFEISEAVMDVFKTQPLTVVIGGLVGLALLLLTHFIVGFFGDRMYYKHTISSIKQIKKSDDADVSFQKRGGVSFGMMLVGYAIVQFLPQIIYYILLSL